MVLNNCLSSSINLCSPTVIGRLDRSLFEQVRMGQDMLSQLSFPSAQRIYIGSESCEYLLCRNSEVLVGAAKRLRQCGLAVTLVTPPVSQFQMESVCALIDRFDDNELADEVVCNDIGVICRCSKSLHHMTIRAGRCFDKITREARFDPFSIEEIQRNRIIYQTPWPLQNEMGNRLKRLGVYGVDLDAVPGGVLQFKECEWDFALWHPGIILSYATTCEFAGSSLPVDQKFVPGRCACECMNYSTELHGETLIKIIKSGRLLQAIDPLDACECFNGNCRVVLDVQVGRRTK